MRRVIWDKGCERHHLEAHPTLFYTSCSRLRCRVARLVGR